MPPYRAQLGGIEGSGQYMSPSGAVDYGQILQSLSGAASSLIQNAYARRLAKKNADLAAQREQRAVEQDKAAAGVRQQELELQREKLRIDKLKAGITPAHAETVPDIPAGEPETIAFPVAPGQPPAPSFRLRTPPLRGGTVQVPEEYDPTKAEGYVRQIDVAKLRTDAVKEGQQAARAAAMDRLERSAELAAQRQLEHDQRVQKGKAAVVARGLTANALEAWRKNMADGVIQNLDGDLNAAEDFLANDEKGRRYAVRGLSAEDLYAAAGRYRAAAGRAATGILSSTSPERAVEKVAQVRKLMRPGGAAADSAAPGAAAAPKIRTPAAAAKTPTDTITAAERDALKQLGWKDADIAAKYIIKP